MPSDIYHHGGLTYSYSFNMENSVTANCGILAITQFSFFPRPVRVQLPLVEGATNKFETSAPPEGASLENTRAALMAFLPRVERLVTGYAIVLMSYNANNKRRAAPVTIKTMRDAQEADSASRLHTQDLVEAIILARYGVVSLTHIAENQVHSGLTCIQVAAWTPPSLRGRVVSTRVAQSLEDMGTNTGLMKDPEGVNEWLGKIESARMQA